MSTPSRLWSNTRYVVWLISDTAKELAGGLAVFALPLLALTVTGEPTQAGIIGAIGTVTILITSLYGGVLADRHDRARMLVLGAVVSAALAAAFTALIVSDSLSFAVLLGIEIVLSVQYGLFGMAGEAILKDIVAPDALGRAQAANQARDAILRLGATPLGGVLLAIGGWLIGAAMLISSLIEAAAALLLARMRKADAAAVGTPDAGAAETPPAAGSVTPAASAPQASTLTDDATDVGAESAASGTATPSRPNAFAATRESVTWLMRRRDLRPVLFVMTLINLGFNTATTAIIYTLQQRGESPMVIGLLGSGIGAATLFGALIATPLVTRVRSGVLAISSLSVATGSMCILPFTTSAAVMIAAPAVALLLTPALNAGLLGYSMVAIPTELVGRVRSAMMVIVSGAMPLAPLIAGIGLSTVGVAGTFTIAAGCCIATLVMALLTPALRALPVEAEWEAHARQFEDGLVTAA